MFKNLPRVLARNSGQRQLASSNLNFCASSQSTALWDVLKFQKAENCMYEVRMKNVRKQKGKKEKHEIY